MSFTYLAIGGPLHNQRVDMQFPVNTMEVDASGQPQVYRKVRVPVFERTFEVLVADQLTTNRNDLSAALANALLSQAALSLWEVGAPFAPQAPQGDGRAVAAPTRQQDAVPGDSGDGSPR